ncbi:MAG TPA: hypothetical protein VHQ95_23675, partial [Pyrinomonadaceae bacterium]|nr:hypothetical protein [Pyrinomonadaceae bacterium]
NREQKHADVFGDFHGLTLLDRYLADNPNRRGPFRRANNAAMRTPQKPGGPVLKRVNRACKSPKALALGASASIGTTLAPAVFKARICQLLQSRHTNKAGL